MQSRPNWLFVVFDFSEPDRSFIEEDVIEVDHTQGVTSHILPHREHDEEPNLLAFITVQLAPRLDLVDPGDWDVSFSFHLLIDCKSIDH
jgi:hypothetical protein